MASSVEKALWFAVFALLITFTIPWFMWGEDLVLVGLPVWVWWYVGWMGLAAIAFRVFADRAWGIGVEGESA